MQPSPTPPTQATTISPSASSSPTALHPQTLWPHTHSSDNPRPSSHGTRSSTKWTSLPSVIKRTGAVSVETPLVFALLPLPPLQLEHLLQQLPLRLLLEGFRRPLQVSLELWLRLLSFLLRKLSLCSWLVWEWWTRGDWLEMLLPHLLRLPRLSSEKIWGTSGRRTYRIHNVTAWYHNVKI